MTATELLAMLGRAWSRLLLYPSGLAAFATLWLLTIVRQHAAGASPHEYVPPLARPWTPLSALVCPWLALALLPLPLAPALPRQTDLVVIVTLLEWPQLLAIAAELGAAPASLRAAGLRRLVGALNSYPPLLLATLALAQAGGSLEVAALARAPGEFAPAGAGWLHWLGVLGWALALPPALGLGAFEARAADQPWAADSAVEAHTETLQRFAKATPRTVRQIVSTSFRQCFGMGALGLGLRLRALGLVVLAALPWAGSLEESAALLRTLVAACLIGAVLWGYARLTRGLPVRRWAWFYMAFNLALLLALLGAGYQSLLSRLE